jgi:hypothetical protein
MIAVVTMIDRKTVMGVIRWSHGKSLSPNGDDTNQTLEQSPNADTAPVLGNWFAIKLRATGKQCTTKIT